MGRSTANTDGIFTGKPIRIPKALRDELEAAVQAHLTAVEKLTAVLDKADGDESLEPSLGSITYGVPAHLQDCEGGDVQDEPHDESDEGNSEPGLAHTNDISQLQASKNLTAGWNGMASDLEEQHDGREPQCEDEGAACEDEGAEHDGREPTLGATNPEPNRPQTGWANHGSEDHYVESPQSLSEA
jgi:hypothetical protein